MKMQVRFVSKFTLLSNQSGNEKVSQWCRRWGCKRTPKSFDLTKIRAKSLLGCCYITTWTPKK